MGVTTDTSIFRHREAKIMTTDLAKSPSVSVTALPTTPIEDTRESSSSSKPVLNPSLITQDFEILIFEAAAFGQLSLAIEQSPMSTASTSSLDSDITESTERGSLSLPLSTLLISSPYNIPGHYLELSHLATPSLLFAKALTALRPTRSDYATAPYTESLNFNTILITLRDLVATQEDFVWPTTSFYVVVFRSKLNASVDKEWLYRLDAESHREACESGGLLKYWFGRTDSERRNLATCFWHSRADAHKGGQGPWHKKARAAGRELYEDIVFSTHRFTVLEGAREWKFENWRDGE